MKNYITLEKKLTKILSIGTIVQVEESFLPNLKPNVPTYQFIVNDKNKCRFDSVVQQPKSLKLFIELIYSIIDD